MNTWPIHIQFTKALDAFLLDFGPKPKQICASLLFNVDWNYFVVNDHKHIATYIHKKIMHKCLK